MRKRYIVEESGQIAQPYRVRDTKTKVIILNTEKRLIAEGWADEQNALLSPPWYTRFWHWLRKTKPQPKPVIIDEHTRRLQWVRDRCEQGQQRISKALFG